MKSLKHTIDNMTTRTFLVVFTLLFCGLVGVVWAAPGPKKLFAGLFDFKPQTDTPAHKEGRFFYDDNINTFVGLVEESDVALNIGEENWIFARNVTGVTITDGQVVYVSGASGNRPTIALARADSEATSRVIGLATHDIEHNTNGYVTIVGLVRGIDTSIWSVGDDLFLDESTAGDMRNTAPGGANRDIHVGHVLVDNPSTGVVLVTIEDRTVVPLAADITVDTVTLDVANASTQLSWAADGRLRIRNGPTGSNNLQVGHDGSVGQILSGSGNINVDSAGGTVAFGPIASTRVEILEANAQITGLLGASNRHYVIGGGTYAFQMRASDGLAWSASSSDANGPGRSLLQSFATGVMRVTGGGSGSDWLDYGHNGTNGVLETGTGDLNLVPAGGDVNVTGNVTANTLTLDLANQDLTISRVAADRYRFGTSSDSLDLLLNGAAGTVWRTGATASPVYSWTDSTGNGLVFTESTDTLEETGGTLKFGSSSNGIQYTSAVMNMPVNKPLSFGQFLTTDANIRWDADTVNKLSIESRFHTVFGIAGANAQNYAHTETDLSVFFHSTTVAGTATDQWLGVKHDTADGVISTGKGDLIFQPTGKVAIDTNAANTAPILALENTAGDVQVFRVDATPEASVTGSRGDLAVGIVGGEGVVYVKRTGDASNTGWGEISPARFSDMHIHDNVVATTINTVSIPHLVQGLFAEVLSDGLTFAAGSTGAITVFADAGGGQVTVTSATHGLANGNIVSISGTTSYNGVFAVANVAANTYEITDTWVADDATGTWYQGDSITVDSGSAGNYSLTFTGYGVTAVNNKDFEFEIVKNATMQEHLEAKRRFSLTSDIGSFASGGILSLADGDVITFSLIGVTDTTNFTIQHVNVSMHRL